MLSCTSPRPRYCWARITMLVHALIAEVAVAGSLPVVAWFAAADIVCAHRTAGVPVARFPFSAHAVLARCCDISISMLELSGASVV
jgi:hypothetical protein